MIQIIGGRWKRRQLAAPSGRTVRPTLGRARQALFDLLGQRCDGQRVLDLFAGSGAVGLEALSRGAARAIFVESGRPALRALERNIETLDARELCAVIAGDAFSLAGEIAKRGPFDLIFADPPYGDLSQATRGQSASRPLAFDERLKELLGTLAASSPEAVVVLQADARSEPPPAELLADARQIGDTTFYFLKNLKME